MPDKHFQIEQAKKLAEKSGQDKSFYAKNTDFDAEQILIEGSPEQGEPRDR